MRPVLSVMSGCSVPVTVVVRTTVAQSPPCPPCRPDPGVAADRPGRPIAAPDSAQEAPEQNGLDR